MLKIAIDTGGTFTDYTAVGSLKGKKPRKIFLKKPTDHQNPAQGLRSGLQELAQAWGVDLAEMLNQTSQISHGTTWALNALLEKKGAKTALFTTEGFRDALEIRRSQLKNQWDLNIQRPEVLVPRRLRLGIRQRMNYQGEVITELDEDSVRQACQKCREAQVQAIAVCFLFSFLNPAHEKRTAEIIRKELPEVFVSISAEVAPRIREYERSSTTVINAYLTPILSDYLHSLKAELAKYGWNKSIQIMLNSGGLSDSATVQEFAVKTLLSGPAGGAVGLESISRILGQKQLVLADMGGTSFDLQVISEGQKQMVAQAEIEDYPLTIPMLDITSVGAGGGSLARVDENGRVLVGPDSAGSVPGSACYGLGGTQATVTDALLLLGLLNENNFGGGRLKLSKLEAQKAIQTQIATPLGLSAMEGASLIYQVALAKMADALRLITTQKGKDPRLYSLVSAGGAFGLFAAGIMELLQMPEVLFPLVSPVFCSWGILGAERRCDYSRSILMEKQKFEKDKIKALIGEMQAEGQKELDRLGVARDCRQAELTLEMRYIGQHHEIRVPIQEISLKAVDEAFHTQHETFYEYAQRELDWEIINLHWAGREVVEENSLFPFSKIKSTAGKTRKVAGEIFNQSAELEVPIYSSNDLESQIMGPALIDFAYTSVLIPAGFYTEAKTVGVLTLKKQG